MTRSSTKRSTISRLDWMNIPKAMPARRLPQMFRLSTTEFMDSGDASLTPQCGHGLRCVRGRAVVSPVRRARQREPVNRYSVAIGDRGRRDARPTLRLTERTLLSGSRTHGTGPLRFARSLVWSLQLWRDQDQIVCAGALVRNVAAHNCGLSIWHRNVGGQDKPA